MAKRGYKIWRTDIFFDICSRISREIEQNCMLGGLRLPLGMLEIPAGFLHRDPDHWPEPEKFNPERCFSYYFLSAGTQLCLKFLFNMFLWKVLGEILLYSNAKYNGGLESNETKLISLCQRKADGEAKRTNSMLLLKKYILYFYIEWLNLFFQKPNTLMNCWPLQVYTRGKS